jgi:hypothetical protein
MTTGGILPSSQGRVAPRVTQAAEAFWTSAAARLNGKQASLAPIETSTGTNLPELSSILGLSRPGRPLFLGRLESNDQSFKKWPVGLLSFVVGKI